MNTRELLRECFKTKKGDLKLAEIYVFALENKDRWNKFDSDYKHKIRTLIHDSQRRGQIQRVGRAAYRKVKDF